MSDDKRLIEDYLPIAAISAEASREKSVRKGHISTLHLWWARRPLVACRAAVYGALVPAPRDRDKAAEFVTRLCKYPGDPKIIAEAQRHILEAHAERLTEETGKPVTVEDIEAGRAPRPKVLDMFAGGGAIPLEALRLGCEAYALDLNPVAHIIELCTLVYPQKYGRPDPNARGMTGPPAQAGTPVPPGETTWGGLAAEVRYWGEWVLNKVKAEIGDLYPPIPDPAVTAKPLVDEGFFPGMTPEGQFTVPGGYLTPVAYLWTRTVICKNPACKATVPLLRQTWLCKKKDRYVALKVTASRGCKPTDSPRVRFEVVESKTEKGLGFDPAAFSKAGNATCPFCETVADNGYVKVEGKAGRIGTQAMAVVCTRPGARGKVYLSADGLPPELLPDEDICRRRIDELCKRTGLTVPDEPMPKPGTLGFRVQPYGIKTWGELFTPRQMLSLLTFAAAVREAHAAMVGMDAERAKAVATLAAAMLDKITTRSNTLDGWDSGYEKIMQIFGRQAIPMVWDFAESNPLAKIGSGNFGEAIEGVVDAVATCSEVVLPGNVFRRTATSQPWPDATLDAVLTDPPYYDNVPYADLSDFFYVWLKRTVGHMYSEHFGGQGTPKKQEAVADATRHGGDKKKAARFYEEVMAESLAEANRVLKKGGTLAVVYAHKTTLGWATLVDGFRRAGFVVTEAWPLDTEGPRLRAVNSAALASSIFLVGRKRDGTATGSYETEVQPELAAIVRERVETLWDQGISGADLVIACVGAGLRAFTRFARVEYGNGAEVPAERFLTEVETVVLDSILDRLSKETAKTQAGTPVPPTQSLAGVDAATRFYILWRYTYKNAELDAGEAIVFANGTHVELDGPHGLSSGTRALVEKKKGKYRLRDYNERGEEDKLGMPAEDGQSAPLIDALQRTLWLMENRPRQLAAFLREAEPNREQMRLAAQALAGPALKGGELSDVSPSAELSALSKLTSNWRSVIEDNVFSASEQSDRKRGQKKLFE